MLSSVGVVTIVTVGGCWSRVRTQLLEAPSSRKVIKAYNKIVKALVAFEYVWYDAWVAQVDTARAGLQATLLVRHPTTRKFYVNFDAGTVGSHFALWELCFHSVVVWFGFVSGVLFWPFQCVRGCLCRDIDESGAIVTLFGVFVCAQPSCN